MAIDLLEVVISDSLLNTEFLVRVLELKEVLSTAPASSSRSYTYWKQESRAIPWAVPCYTCYHRILNYHRFVVWILLRTQLLMSNTHRTLIVVSPLLHDSDRRTTPALPQETIIGISCPTILGRLLTAPLWYRIVVKCICCVLQRFN